MSSNPQLSIDLFNQAVAMKRAGRFNEAIALQKKSILAYPDDPDIMENYYSMGKIFYLAGRYEEAIEAYFVYDGLCELRNPAILIDYQKSNNGDFAAEQRLFGAYLNLAAHFGHAVMDPKDNGQHKKEIEFYQQELMGKKPGNSPVMSKYVPLAEEYEKQLIPRGFNIICNNFDRMLANPQKAKQTILDIMQGLVLL